MGLSIRLEKHDDTPDRCVYTFGAPSTPVGRVILHKDSGDLELVDLSAADDTPNERYYLAHVVPRLQAYHDRATYPESDQWEA